MSEIPIKNIGLLVYTGRTMKGKGLTKNCEYRIVDFVPRDDGGVAYTYTILNDDNKEVTIGQSDANAVALLNENVLQGQLIYQAMLLEQYDHVNPDHYKTNDKEVWEYMIEIYGKEKFIAFCELNVFKYSMRVGKKPGASVEDDLGKIKWYAEKIKQLRDE